MKRVWGFVVRVRVPSRRVMMRRERLRPIPLPVGLVVKKGVKIWEAMCSGTGVPSLVSFISIDSSSLISASTVTIPAPASIAFFSILRITCPSKSLSVYAMASGGKMVSLTSTSPTFGNPLTRDTILSKNGLT